MNTTRHAVDASARPPTRSPSGAASPTLLPLNASYLPLSLGEYTATKRDTCKARLKYSDAFVRAAVHAGRGLNPAAAWLRSDPGGVSRALNARVGRLAITTLRIVDVADLEELLIARGGAKLAIVLKQGAGRSARRWFS